MDKEMEREFNKKGRAVKVFILIAVLLVALVAVYIFTDLLKSPKMLFYKYLGQSLGYTVDYEKTLENIKKNETKCLATTGNISMNIVDDYKEQSNARVDYIIKTDGAQQKAYANLNIQYNRQALIQAELLQNQETYGIRIPEAYDKYISVENNNLRQIAEKLGLDSTNFPNKIEQTNIYDLLYISKEDRTYLKDKYLKLIDEQITVENYTKQDSVTMEVNAKEVKGNAYILSMSSTQLKEITLKLLQTLKEDEKTLELILSKVASINKEGLTKATLREAIQEEINTLKDIKTSSTTEGFRITVYSYFGKTVKTEVVIDDQKFVIANKKENNSVKSNMQLEDKEEGTITNIELIYTEESKDNQTITATIKQGQQEIKFEMNSKTVPSVSIDSFTKDNSIKLNDMSTQELQLTYMNVGSKLMNLFTQKSQLF